MYDETREVTRASFNSKSLETSSSISLDQQKHFFDTFSHAISQHNKSKSTPLDSGASFGIGLFKQHDGVHGLDIAAWKQSRVFDSNLQAIKSMRSSSSFDESTSAEEVLDAANENLALGLTINGQMSRLNVKMGAEKKIADGLNTLLKA